RTYAAGTYYIGLSNFNFANNQPQPPDVGESLVDNVMDFPNCAAESSSTTALNVNVTISDGAGGHLETIPAVKARPFDIVWVKFTVGTVACPCPGDMDSNTLQNGLDIMGFAACMTGGGANCGCA